MSSFLFGLFIGAVIGANIGLVILVMNMSNRNIREKLLKENANKPEESAPNPKRRMDPFEATIPHYCWHCNHKWREYPLLSAQPLFCPKCGRSLEEEAFVASGKMVQGSVAP